MTTETLFAVFADFNEPSDEPPPPPPIEEDPPVFDEIGRIKEEAWTDGYLAGRRETGSGSGNGGATLTAKLLTTLHDLDAGAAGAVHEASLAVGDLLVGTVIALAAGDWSAQLPGRVRMVADRIRPALTVAPEFVLRDGSGAEQSFADIAGLTRALDDGAEGEDVTIRWRRGEATISRSALIEDLREAVLPLSAGLVNKQNAGQRT